MLKISSRNAASYRMSPGTSVRFLAAVAPGRRRRCAAFVAAGVVAMAAGPAGAPAALSSRLRVSAVYKSSTVIARVVSRTRGPAVLQLRAGAGTRSPKRRLMLRPGIVRTVMLTDPRAPRAPCSAKRISIVATQASSSTVHTRVAITVLLPAEHGGSCATAPLLYGPS